MNAHYLWTLISIILQPSRLTANQGRLNFSKHSLHWGPPALADATATDESQELFGPWSNTLGSRSLSTTLVVPLACRDDPNNATFNTLATRDPNCTARFGSVELNGRLHMEAASRKIRLSPFPFSSQGVSKTFAGHSESASSTRSSKNGSRNSRP